MCRQAVITDNQNLVKILLKSNEKVLFIVQLESKEKIDETSCPYNNVKLS